MVPTTQSLSEIKSQEFIDHIKTTLLQVLSHMSPMVSTVCKNVMLHQKSGVPRPSTSQYTDWWTTIFNDSN